MIETEERYISIKQIAELLSYSESHVKHAIICRPDFPKPLRIGHPRWKVSEVLEWADSLKAS